jgi:hypothetical protein
MSDSWGRRERSSSLAAAARCRHAHRVGSGTCRCNHCGSQGAGEARQISGRRAAGLATAQVNCFERTANTAASVRRVMPSLRRIDEM